MRQRQRLHEPSSSDRSRRNPESYTAETRDRSPGYPRVPLRRHCFAEQQPRTRHRTKLETQWDRSGHRPTWGHFLSRSVGTRRKRVITTIAFDRAVQRSELHCQCSKIDRPGSQRPRNPGHPREPTRSKACSSTTNNSFRRTSVV